MSSSGDEIDFVGDANKWLDRIRCRLTSPQSGYPAASPSQATVLANQLSRHSHQARYRTHLMCIMACIRSMHSVNPDSPRSDDSFPHLNITLTKSIFSVRLSLFNRVVALTLQTAVNWLTECDPTTWQEAWNWHKMSSVAQHTSLEQLWQHAKPSRRCQHWWTTRVKLVFGYKFIDARTARTHGRKVERGGWYSFMYVYRHHGTLQVLGQAIFIPQPYTDHSNVSLWSQGEVGVHP